METEYGFAHFRPIYSLYKLWQVLNLSAMANDLSMEKLSSGYHINRAADDAAGLAVVKN